VGLGLTKRIGAMSTTGKAVLGLFCCLLLLAVVAGGGLFYVQHRLDSHITRIDGVFDGVPNRPDRPSGRAGDATNILMMGTDARAVQQTTGNDGTGTWMPGAQRSDTLMLLHIDADGKAASVISVPRDTWVQVPGHGMAKINAGFSYGGPRLAVHTFEHLTGIRVDHIAWIDWDGFRQLTDALGGVDINVPETVESSGSTLTKGVHHFDGEEALAYVRQRHGLPGGDFDRIQRQHNFLRSLMDSTRGSISIAHPGRAYSILDAIAANLTVDSGFSTGDLRGLMFQTARMQPDAIEFLTAPVAGLGMEGAQSVVYLDDERAAQLWHDVRQDQVDEWVSQNPLDETGRIVR